MNSKPIKKPGKLGMAVIAVLLVLTMCVNIACAAFQKTLDQFLGSRAELSEELLLAGNTLAETIQEEGTVLLKNEDAVLPLSKDSKAVNVFGWSATQWINGGSGSGQCATLDTDFLAALKEAGIAYNQELIDMYRGFLDNRPFTGMGGGALGTYPEEFSRLYEPSISDESLYTPELLKNAENFSDTAVVVLGRQAGESNDAPAVQYKQVSAGADVVTDETRHYLEISTEEEELLKYVGETYENVVVIVNNTNTMNLSFLETIPGLDACLLAGGTGANGTRALVRILYGDVNPSGHLTDTYAYDFASAAGYATSGARGLGYYTNAEGLYPFDGVTTNGNVGDKPLYTGVAYEDYVEGIYVGYKWYETADTEGFWNGVSNEFGKGYEGIVQYPFGYGLSYTDFEWEVVDKTEEALTKDGTVSVTVKVTNTGDIAGKEVVQLYVNPPYYTGEIEKSSVNLVDFAKTDLLAPGESQEVTLTASAESLASYDCYDANKNGFTGWELDKGEYTFMVSANAHEAADTFVCTLAENVQYPIDSYSGNEVKNLFTGEEAVDGVPVDGGNAGVAYLTRADFEGSFLNERKEDRPMDDDVRALNLFTEEMANAWIGDTAEAVTTGAKNGLSVTDRGGKINDLGMQLGSDYNDPQWETLLDQLTQKEMEELVCFAYVQTAALPSIGKPKTTDLDGPSQIGSFAFWWFGSTGTGFSNPTVLAQTFNKELSYEFGQANAAQARQLGVNGWYAPGVNIHRSVMGGRNFEYYSEDPVLSGVMCAETVRGSLDAGIYVYAKHFVAYEQESARDGVYTWMSEQALREVYLRPFKMIINEGGCTGIMSSYGRLGAVWAGGSTALLTSLLRDEWGFEGCVLTDYSDHPVYMNGDHMLRAGGDLWMAGMTGGTLNCEKNSNSYMQALRRAAKNTTYMYLNAAVKRQQNVENGGNPTYIVEYRETMNIWLTALSVFDTVMGALIIFLIYLRVRKHKLYKKQNV